MFGSGHLASQGGAAMGDGQVDGSYRETNELLTFGTWVDLIRQSLASLDSVQVLEQTEGRKEGIDGIGLSLPSFCSFGAEDDGVAVFLMLELQFALTLSFL
ncbi:hypothetical protein RHMOL_Rhmol04G0019900 [Rhododendron molle]|uniref:Uncharacterized protein n=2 Tax=Rhododendron molle TaxID=49168 RepID=A0ACC0NYI1_RHOML|nr:hypothetical protein RHMOL_Rhmol04G0019900 [Rhododendron molle]KAI8557558.1 hypothetical protein RHMOL_Rhmol04G0019900 [Rhododendron molle]